MAQSPSTNLAVRLLTAAVVAPALIALLFWGPAWAFLTLLLVSSAMASLELMTIVLPHQRVLQVWGVAVTLIWVCVPWLKFDQREMMTLLIGMVVLGLSLGLLRAKPIEHAASRLSWLIAGPLYVGGLNSALGALYLKPNGPEWVLLTLTIAWFGDTGGYFAGRAFGRHKLYEEVSPKKTVEGSIGALFGSGAGALMAHFWYLPSLPLWNGIALALVGGAFGQAGDLCESLMKRSERVKDSGWIVPGHGGVLDRIDALMFSSAATWAYVTWVHPT